MNKELLNNPEVKEIVQEFIKKLSSNHPKEGVV